MNKQACVEDEAFLWSLWLIRFRLMQTNFITYLDSSRTDRRCFKSITEDRIHRHISNYLWWRGHKSMPWSFTIVVSSSYFILDQRKHIECKFEWIIITLFWCPHIMTHRTLTFAVSPHKCNHKCIALQAIKVSLTHIAWMQHVCI